MADRPIRQARAADHAAVMACIRAAYAKYLVRMDKEPAPLHADYQALIARGVVFVLPDAGGVRGVVVMMPHEGSMFVESVAVAPCCQGQGLGTLLMAFVERQARAQHLGQIRLYTNEVMTENLRYYQQRGFEEEGRQVQDGYRRVFLRKILA
jgi:N-acetylglutamate synthase-like GNAT family acetyltransferase